MTQPPTITSTQRIYDAVRDLRAQDQIATRETVAELTGLKLTIVDDRLRALVDDGRLKRLIRGIYELVEVFPPARTISKTVLDNGFTMIEVGDDVVLHLTPSEDRALGLLQMGAATQAATIESSRQYLFLVTELAAKVESQGREIKALRAAIKGDGPSPQGTLI